MAFTSSNASFKPRLDELDKSQYEAVVNEEPRVVIEAPAGSGKTKSLITAIANYRYNYINDRICAITYTRAARAEMQERLKELGIYDVDVTTIHVWAKNQLEIFADRYDFKLFILEEKRIKLILKDLVNEYLIRSRVKSVNIDILYNYITGSKLMDVTDNYRRTLRALEERYIRYKRENHLYDFTDYPLYLWDVMTVYHETIENIDALFVDEFQDVDSTQFEIFNKVNCHKKFFIGDKWQSIFVFRGADGQVFRKLDNFKRYKLKYNYRSYQEIIDFATTAYVELSQGFQQEITDLKTFYVDPSDINCIRGYGNKEDGYGRVSIIDQYCDAATIQKDEDLIYFKTVRTNGLFEYIMNKNPMILCRTNKQVKAIQTAGYFNVSTVHQAKGLEYDNVIVIDWPLKMEDLEECSEDLNVAYVALTRARDNLVVINWEAFEQLFSRQLGG